jgi:hypothetical protein
MRFNHVGQPHFLYDEDVDAEEHTVPVLIHFPEANGTLEPTLNFGKSHGSLVAIVLIVSASRWPCLLVFLIIIIVTTSLSRMDHRWWDNLVLLQWDRFNLGLLLDHLLPHVTA